MMKSQLPALRLRAVLSSQGKYSEAEQMHRQTLELIETVLGHESRHRRSIRRAIHETGTMVPGR